ncbi:ABC transporter ATP-binding protein [Bradyrhizobium australafricanum]|uniref:ABC transporter ATP-binding protein n=1 Tax=Bradyrhizobium australafricanum TaxID=2821406 RepID=UPI001CE25764|nr:ABC transporter ATP-binding protein [Bradyrhizobium australafricanum]
MHPKILEIRDLTIQFGGVVALDGVSFDMDPATILGLIGPNGAGKTTLFNCLSRLYNPDSGDVLFQETSILQMASHRIVDAGIGRTFQNLALFGSLSVLDNVRIGTHSRFNGSFLSDAFYFPSTGRNEKAAEIIAREAIDYLGLGPVANRRISDLPFGTQKRVELARSLATNPKLLLLDEPACGLNHEEVEELSSVILQIRRDRGIAILLVEHHMALVMSISDKVVALNFGKKIGEGTPTEIRSHPEVIAAYLGAEAP